MNEVLKDEIFIGIVGRDEKPRMRSLLWVLVGDSREGRKGVYKRIRDRLRQRWARRLGHLGEGEAFGGEGLKLKCMVLGGCVMSEKSEMNILRDERKN